jgi:hypothetical protein
MYFFRQDGIIHRLKFGLALELRQAAMIQQGFSRGDSAITQPKPTTQDKAGFMGNKIA